MAENLACMRSSVQPAVRLDGSRLMGGMGPWIYAGSLFAAGMMVGVSIPGEPWALPKVMPLGISAGVLLPTMNGEPTEVGAVLSTEIPQQLVTVALALAAELKG